MENENDISNIFNVTIETSHLVNKLEQLKNYFSPTDKAYEEITQIVNGNILSKNSQELLENLTKNYPLSVPIKAYVEGIYKESNILAKQQEQIIKTEESLSARFKVLKEEFEKRGLSTEGLAITYKRTLKSPEEIEQYYNLLTKESEKVTKIEESLGIKKELGEAFDENFKQETDIIDKESLKDVNEKAEENVKVLNNPTIDTLKIILNNYNSTRYHDEIIKTKIVRTSDDNIAIELSRVGTTVDEQSPKIVINCAELDKSNYQEFTEVIRNYAMNNTTKSSANEDGNYINESVSGDILEVENFPDEQLYQTDEYIRQVQENTNENAVKDEENVLDSETDSNQIKKEKQKVRVRKKEEAKASPSMLLMPILVILILLAIFLTYYIIVYV